MSRSAYVIGFSGLKNSGKDSAALLLQSNKKLAEQTDFVCFAFAQPIRTLCIDLFNLEIYHFDREHKDIPLGKLNNKTPREVLRIIGNTAREIDKYIWINQVKDEVYEIMKLDKQMQWQPFSFLFTDVRTVEEQEYIHSLGGQIWEIQRPGEISDGHSTEQPQLLSPTVKIINDGTIAELGDKLVKAFSEQFGLI